MTHIETFKKHFDFGNIKDINPNKIEARCRNLEYGIAIANRVINKYKLNLKVNNTAEMAAYKAFEIIAKNGI